MFLKLKRKHIYSFFMGAMEAFAKKFQFGSQSEFKLTNLLFAIINLYAYEFIQYKFNYF